MSLQSKLNLKEYVKMNTSMSLHMKVYKLKVIWQMKMDFHKEEVF